MILQDWEISAASRRLAECQATILDLGKQLKALAAPKDAALFDKVISPASAARIVHRAQLLDQMQAEDEAASDHLKSPKTKEIICAEIKQPPPSTTSEANPNAGLLYGRKFLSNAGSGAIKSMNSVNQPLVLNINDDKQKGETGSGRLVIVTKKKNGGVSVLLKKLLSRKKNGSGRKPLALGL